LLVTIYHRYTWTGSIILLLAAAGCQSFTAGPPPVGPGAATAADLTPWLPQSTRVRQSGTLMEFNVAAMQGSYDTWSLAAAVAEESVEVDIRACPGAAEDFRGKPVVIEGRLIPRGKYNLPLLVADRILPADSNGNPLADLAHHIALSPEPDPATSLRDPITAFNPDRDRTMASSGN
jgi:hypothetical protein